MTVFNFFLTRFTVLLFVLISIFSITNAQESILFSSDDPLKISVKADLRKLIKSKADGEELEGEMTIENKSYPVRLKVRGNYNREECSFPPIILNFNKAEFDHKELDYLKNLKMVNACQDQGIYEQYILREYMIYRIFNLLSDKSLRARLLVVDFEDSKGKMSTVTRYGLLVEDEYMMAKRLNGMITKQEGLNDRDTNQEQIVLLSIFQFMIGNTDWQLSKLHKLYLIRINESMPYAVPYDFDYSGMVNASFAAPSPVLGINSVRERLYWGKCYAEQELEEGISVFLDKKEDMINLYTSFEFFNDSSRDEAMEYLDGFYDIIENKTQWKKYFLDNCRE